MLIDGLESCELLVDYCDVFISCLDSHTAPIHCSGPIVNSDGMLHFFKSVPMKKQTHLYLHLSWGWVNFSANFHFWVNYSFTNPHVFIKQKRNSKEQNRTVWMCSSQKLNADGVFENFRLSLVTFNYMSVCFCKALHLGDPHPWESTYALGLIDIGISMRNVKLD